MSAAAEQQLCRAGCARPSRAAAPGPGERAPARLLPGSQPKLQTAPSGLRGDGAVAAAPPSRAASPLAFPAASSFSSSRGRRSRPKALSPWGCSRGRAPPSGFPSPPPPRTALAAGAAGAAAAQHLPALPSSPPPPRGRRARSSQRVAGALAPPCPSSRDFYRVHFFCAGINK